MATYNLTPVEDFSVLKTVSLTKTIGEAEKVVSVSRAYLSATWEGELTTAEVDTINDFNDDFVSKKEALFDEEPINAPEDEGDGSGADNALPGLFLADYSTLELTETSENNNLVFNSDLEDQDEIDALEATFESLGLAGLEDLGWTAGTEAWIVNSNVVLTEAEEV